MSGVFLHLRLMTSPKRQKKKFLERLTDESGVAVVIVDGESREVAAANNNSMCRTLTASLEFAPACGEYCGKAFERASKANGVIEYECYAGLTCKAVPVREAGKQFVAIVGRTFLKSENYRKATERAISGDWRKFRPTEFFGNILISGSTAGIDKTIERLESFSAREPDDLLEVEPQTVTVVAPEPAEKSIVRQPDDLSNLIRKFHSEIKATPVIVEVEKPIRDEDDAKEIAEWRSLFGSLLQMKYRNACAAFLDFLGNRYGLSSIVFFEVRNNQFHNILSRGRLAEKLIRIGITPDNPRIREAASGEQPFELHERASADQKRPRRVLNIFPVTVGGDIRGAVGVEGNLPDSQIKRRIARVSQTVASQLEILRLRDEVSQRDWLSRAVRKFNESLKKIDADDFWQHVTQISAELLQAERASLLVRSDKSDSLQTKAAIGARINLLAAQDVGSRISRQALEDGKPIVAADILKAGFQRAPKDWSYRTSSFITYPILIGERRVAVLNFTDKATGEVFGERDLEILQAIAPQIAVAIDHTALKHKAGEFEQLSVTDALTGLLNRRYLQERLLEELNRSKRYRFPMSLLMLDVDKFKSYNDTHGHPAGDKALKMVAGILKENLRGADVAARYGGEEFAILLPQTTADEAGQIAERIRRHIERTEFPHRRVTVSIGIANCTTSVQSPDDLIWAADRALYEAKECGRNNVRVFDDEANPLPENVH